MVITVVAWTISGAFSELPKIVRDNRLALLLPGVFLLIAFGMVHGPAPFGERVRSLWKYDDLLLPLVLIPLFLDSRVRARGLWAFSLAMGLTLVISLGLAAGWIPTNSWLHGGPANATVFKQQITHNLLMAFAALLFAEVGRQSSVPWQRYGLAVLAIGAVIDVFMLVQGRTGQLVLCALIIVWSIRSFGLRGLAVGATAVAMLVVLSYAASPVFQKRVEKTMKELEKAQVETVAPVGSSVGLRVEWYQRTAQLIAAHPVIGVGTGSFALAYAELASEPMAVKPAHPHNQYLLTVAELGAVGAVLLPGLFGILWWKFRSADAHLYAVLGQGVVITLALGCVFNSLLIDHTEGLFWGWMVSAALTGANEGVGGRIC
ncbi:MAG: O-antigen ligase family protein [Nitrospira sp.]|nr:O-antigen ligase family protein [Nitrospira sp.]